MFLISWLLSWPHNLLLVAAGYAFVLWAWKRMMDVAQTLEDEP